MNVILPDTTRVKWVSGDAELVWKPRMEAIRSAWEQIERGRRSCLQSAKPDELPVISRWAAPRGVYLLILEQEGASDMYSSDVKPFVEGQPYVYRFALTGEPQKFSEAWAHRDDILLGKLLEYPDCCTTFFREHWVTQRFLDTTWPQAVGSLLAHDPHYLEDREEPPGITVNSSPECNLLWRWMGVRPVSHLPCSFECEGTRKQAVLLRRLAGRLGFETEMDWMYQILSWPVEWSALHGYAEVKTPVCTIITRTDSTEKKYTIRYTGTGYPEEGAKGIVFPYRNS